MQKGPVIAHRPLMSCDRSGDYQIFTRSSGAT